MARYGVTFTNSSISWWRGSSVGTVTRLLGWKIEGSRFCCQQGQENIQFSVVFRPALVPIEPIQLLHVSRDMKPTFQTYMVDTLQISYTYTFSCVCIAKCVIQQRDKLIVYISRYFIVGLLMVEILGCPASRNKCKVICLILGNSPESEFYIPTFRNTLFRLHRRIGVEILHLSAYEDGTDRVFWNVGI